MLLAPRVGIASSERPAVGFAAASRRRARRGLLGVLLLVFLGNAALYSVAVPIWEAPDEPEHFQYVRYLLQEHALPIRLPTIQTDGSEEGKQPPLYYLLAAPFALGSDLRDAARIRLNPHLGWPHDPAVAAHTLNEGWPYHGVALAAHRVRLLSVLLGALTVAFAYGVAVLCLGSRRRGLLAASFVALLPGFVFASATFNNDMLVDALSAAMLYVVLRARPGHGWRPALGFGVLGCLALLSKLDAAIPLAVGALALMARAAPRQRPRILIATIAPLFPALAYWTWRLGRAGSVAISSNVRWPPPLPGSNGPLNWAALHQFLLVLGTTFVGAFGWPDVWLPAWVYALYGAVIGGGLVLALWTAKRGDGPATRSDLLVLCGWLGAVLAAVLGQPFLVRGGFSAYGHSRYLYPALPAVATLMAYGWSRACERVRALRAIAWAAAVIGIVSALAIPWLVIRPAYATPYPVSDRLPSSATSIANGLFSPYVALAGAQLPRTPVGAGEAVRVTFYWRVQQPLPDGTWLFVHVQDAQGHVAAAFDGAPLYGLFPLSYWRLGDVVLDQQLLTVHRDAASGTYQVKVGWYNPKTGQRAPLADGGNELTAGELQIAGATATGRAR